MYIMYVYTPSHGYLTWIPSLFVRRSSEPCGEEISVEKSRDLRGKITGSYHLSPYLWVNYNDLNQRPHY